MLEVKKEINVLKTDAFHKIVIDFIFPCCVREDFSIYGNLLVRMLTKKTNAYPNEEAFSNALIENYVMDFSFGKVRCGENWFYTYRVIIPDKNVLKDSEYDCEKTLKFIKNSIYEPYALEDSFYDSEVENAKNKLKIYIEGNFKNINRYAHMRMEELVDDAGYFNDALYKHKEEIESVTSADLFHYYQEVIENKCPLVFAVGNIQDDFIKALENVLPNKENVTFVPYEPKPLLPRKNITIVNEVKEYNQSIIKMAYKIERYTKEDEVMLSLLRFLLSSGSSRVLSDYLRDRDKLVYVVGSDYHAYHGLFLITAQIYRDKKEQAINTIHEVMALLEDVTFVQEKIENIKERKRINLERQKDSFASIVDDFQIEYFKTHDTLVEEFEKLKKITAEDFITFMKRLKLDTIYYLEGSKDE